MKPKTHKSKTNHQTAKNSLLSSLSNSYVKRSSHVKAFSEGIDEAVWLEKVQHSKEGSNKHCKKQKVIFPDSKKKKVAHQPKSGHSKQKVKERPKFAQNIQTIRKYNLQKNGQISYREYCLVGDHFLPVETADQENKILEIMRSTVDTTNFKEDIHQKTLKNIFPFKLRSNIQLPEQDTLRTCDRYQKRIHHQGVDSKPQQQKNQRKCPVYQEIGIQYSERLQEKPIQQAVGKTEVDIQTEFESCGESELITPIKGLEVNQIQGLGADKGEQEECQTLSDLLLKLQFKHLPNEKCFQNLSKNEKQHYSELLSSLVSKLTVAASPRGIQKLPTSASKPCNLPIEEIPLEQQGLALASRAETAQLKYERLQTEIYLRECYQMNWVERPPGAGESAESVNTSMVGIMGVVFNLFGYVQLNHPEEFLFMIQAYYGPSFREQLSRVSRGSAVSRRECKVLDAHVFETFCQQSFQSLSEYELCHMSAVFDCVNQCLDTYRPHYHHSGEPFPWSVQMYNNICEYSFDENSLEIVFGLVKETLEQHCSMLCGILVDPKLLQNSEPNNPLAEKRQQREAKLVNSQAEGRPGEHHQIDCQATGLLLQISDRIFQELILEAMVTEPMVSGFFEIDSEEESASFAELI